jgi:hypothetical protein
VGFIVWAESQLSFSILFCFPTVSQDWTVPSCKFPFLDPFSSSTVDRTPKFPVVENPVVIPRSPVLASAATHEWSSVVHSERNEERGILKSSEKRIHRNEIIGLERRQSTIW